MKSEHTTRDTAYAHSYAPADIGVLQARFALRLTAALNERTREIPHDLTERLRAAREQALERARHATRTAEVPQLAGASGSASMTMPSPMSSTDGWWIRIGSVLPLIVLVLGLLMIQRWHANSQISAAAEIDAALLADDVPPSAYADPGFVEFLKAPPN